MVEYLHPKDITIYPDVGMPTPRPVTGLCMFNTLDDVIFFNEKTFTRARLRKYLAYLHWYCRVALSPDVTLEALLHPPDYQRSWLGPKI